jgi:hypothetical protein
MTEQFYPAVGQLKVEVNHRCGHNIKVNIKKRDMGSGEAE